MRNVFKSLFTITQGFGQRPEYYKQFGLKGHEGIDLIPQGSDWSVVAAADGRVVRDENNAKSGAYGNYVTLWHPSLKKATQYCHLQSNTVSLNQEVKAGETIGVMGATGNTQGAHLHLNVFDVDENGVRLNKDNGYQGGIDPRPFLDGGMQDELDKVRAERDKNWNLYQDANKKAGDLTAQLAAEQGKTFHLRQTLKQLKDVITNEGI